MGIMTSTVEECNSFTLLTMHKAGSSYAAQILKEVFERHGYSIVDLATAGYDRGVDEHDYVAEQAEFLCASDSFFGPFRGRSNCLAAQCSPARPIIHIRDPRDCVVSLYYSLRYSHAVPPGAVGARFLETRSNLERMSLDAYVQNFALCGAMVDESFLPNLQLFRQLLEVKPDSILSRYEDMVMEFPDWLVSIAEQTGIEIDYEIVIDIVRRVDFLNTLRVVEDVNNHKRQVIPGDYKRKLSILSQKTLTDFFRDELRYFDYI
jgi:hypothetical protein